MSSSVNKFAGSTAHKSTLKAQKSQKVYDLRLQTIREYQEIVHYLHQINGKLENLNTVTIPELNETLRTGERLITTIYTLFKSTVFTVDQLSKNQLLESTQNNRHSEYLSNRRDTELNNLRHGNYHTGRMMEDGTMMRSSPPVNNTYNRDLMDNQQGDGRQGGAGGNRGEELPWFTSLYETNRPKLI